jgi:SAM-dependent methyltransferase
MSYVRKFFNLLTRGNKVGTTNESTRKQWVERTLSELPAGLRLLDAGAGEQQYKKNCTHLNYVSQDFAQYNGLGDSAGLQMGKWDNSNLDIVGDITNIPEPDASFDVILCTEVFEHLPNPIAAIQEFSRLLKQGGKVIITAPFCSLTHFAPYHFYSGFNRYFYETHLAESGFNSIAIEYNGNYFEYVAQEVRRIEDVAITYSERPKVRLIERMAIWLTLGLLKRMSKYDKGSNELLHFGIHVHAIKA